MCPWRNSPGNEVLAEELHKVGKGVCDTPHEAGGILYLGLVEGACCGGGQVCIVMGFKLGYIAKLGWDGFTWSRRISFGFKSLCHWVGQ